MNAAIGHSQLEGDRQVDHDHDQERDQRLERLARDLAAPARADGGDRDVVGVHAELAGDRVFSSATVWAPVSNFVWTVPAVLLAVGLLHDGVADAAGLDRVLHLGERGVDARGTVKTAPPLKSTLKDRPRTSTATMLMTRINPEMAYHRRCRPTKSNETSPR